MKLPLYILLSFLFASLSSIAQEIPSEDKSINHSISLAAELNHSGYNGILLYGISFNRQQLSIGPSYNISDSYINRPLIGFAADYKYEVLSGSKFSHDLALAFRHQRPLKQTRFNQLSLASYSGFKASKRIQLNLGVGFGFVNEKRIGSLSSSSNLLGSFVQLGCEYTL